MHTRLAFFYDQCCTTRQQVLGYDVRSETPATHCSGQNDKGEPFDWHARRHRKQRTPHHKIKEHKRFNPLAWLKIGKFTDSQKHFVSYLSPVLTMFGSTLFAINNASQASKHVRSFCRLAQMCLVSCVFAVLIINDAIAHNPQP